MSEPSPQAGARDMELASTKPVGTPADVGVPQVRRGTQPGGQRREKHQGPGAGPIFQQPGFARKRVTVTPPAIPVGTLVNAHGSGWER